MSPAAVIRASAVLFILCFSAASLAAHPGWQQASEEGRFVVRFQPQADTITIGRFENWVITVHDDAGKAVYPARIGLAGGMPGHGHGMPTQPQVTEYLGNGRYLVEGMKFNMAGEWVFGITLETPTGRDLVMLAIRVDY